MIVSITPSIFSLSSEFPDSQDEEALIVEVSLAPCIFGGFLIRTARPAIDPHP
jgi:hypothetical protein